MRKKIAFALIEILIVLVILGVIMSFTLPNFMGTKTGSVVKKAENLEFGAQKSKIITVINSAIMQSSALSGKRPSDTSSNIELADILAKGIAVSRRKNADDGWIMLYTSDGLRIDIPDWSYSCKTGISDSNGTDCFVYVDLNSDNPPSDYSAYNVDAYKEGAGLDILPVLITDTEIKGVFEPNQAYRAIVNGSL